MTFRRASRSDADLLTELYLHSRRTAAAAGSIPPLAHDHDDVRGWVKDVVIARRQCWVADRSGKAVGMLVLNNEWIDQLYVEPGLTGSGIGSELIVLAKRERPDRLELWCFVSNEGAQRFYVRHGFEEIERTEGDNEEGAPDIHYVWTPTALEPRTGRR